MKKHDLSVLVIGAGAIGGITAATLSREGYNVTVVTKYPDYAEKVRNEGISVTGAKGSFRVCMPAAAALSEIKGKKDIIILATKATDLGQAARESLSLLSENGRMIATQNGICEHELASIAGSEKTVGCVVGWGATMTSPGELVMTSEGDFIIGYIDREPDEKLRVIGEILSCVVPVKITSNILGHRYAKLIINSCITSMGAVCGLYLGQMLSIARMRRIFINIIREAVMVANAMNLRIEVFGGKLDFYKFIEKTGFIADLKRNLMIRVIGFKYRRLKSSSLQSLERGRQTEVSYLNGYIVDNAEKFNVDVPVNRKITEIIRNIENGQLTIGLNNFSDPVFD